MHRVLRAAVVLALSAVSAPAPARPGAAGTGGADGGNDRPALPGDQPATDVGGDVEDARDTEDASDTEDAAAGARAVEPPPDAGTDGPTAVAVEAQKRHEEAEPRPPLPPPIELPPAPRWERRLEVGVDFAWVDRPFASALADSPVRYAPAPGWGIHLGWELFPWLRFHPYFVHAVQAATIPAGALATTSASSVSRAAVVDEASAATFVFGGKLAPTWPISSRARAWLGVGLGWGRFALPAMGVTEPDGSRFELRERDGVFLEIPITLGISYDVIPRWLAVGYEASAAPVIAQSGAAHESAQAMDADGNARDVAPLGAFEGSFVQTIGLSLLL